MSFAVIHCRTCAVESFRSSWRPSTGMMCSRTSSSYDSAVDSASVPATTRDASTTVTHCSRYSPTVIRVVTTGTPSSRARRIFLMSSRTASFVVPYTVLRVPSGMLT